MSATTITATVALIGWFVAKNSVKVQGPFEFKSEALESVDRLGEEFPLLVPKLAVVYGSCAESDVGHVGGNVTILIG